MEAAWGDGEKAKRLRSTNWQLQNIHRDVKYHIRNTVNNIVITMYGVRWVLDTGVNTSVGMLLSTHYAVYLKVIEYYMSIKIKNKLKIKIHISFKT